MSQSEPPDDKPKSAVGYGRPPRNRQFKPGQSGNPRGRPKGRKNFATALADGLRRPVKVRDKNGKIRTLTAQEAMIEVQINKALAGDGKAFAKVVQLADEYGAFKEQLQSTSEDMKSRIAKLDERLQRLARAAQENRIESQNDPRLKSSQR